MPKESSSKKPAPASENPIVKDYGPSPTPKKPCFEIDETFSTKKRKKSEQERAEKLVDDESAKAKKLKNKKIELKENEYRDSPSRPRKKSVDGFVVYKEEELGLGKSDAPKKSCNEIDEIFSSKKRKKSEQQEKAEKQADDKSAKAKKPKKKKNKKIEVKEKEYRDLPSRPRKKTGDGLVVYTEQELGLGKPDAGGTPLCPFDCDCCF